MKPLTISLSLSIEVFISVQSLLTTALSSSVGGIKESDSWYDGEVVKL